LENGGNVAEGLVHPIISMYECSRVVRIIGVAFFVFQRVE
jgi:hypothetical protein